MRMRREFRPQVSEWLEGRVVPSTAAATVPPPAPAIVLGQAVPLPSAATSNAGVQAAFDTFIQGYRQAVATVLFSAGPGGAVDPAANRASFDAVVQQGLITLADQVVAALGNLASDPAVVAQVRAAILGDSPDSLASQLQSLPTATIAQDFADGAVPDAVLQAARQALALATGQALATGRALVAQGGAATAQAEAVSTGKDAATASSPQVLPEVRAAFGSFLTAYYRAVRDVLLAAGPEGTVNPAANRAAFDARVDAALQDLVDRVAATLAGDPATSALAGGVSESFLGDDPASLAKRLKAVPTPAGSGATALRAFTLESFRAAVDVFTLVAGDLAPLLGTAPRAR